MSGQQLYLVTGCMHHYITNPRAFLAPLSFLPFVECAYCIAGASVHKLLCIAICTIWHGISIPSQKVSTEAKTTVVKVRKL